MRIIACHSNLDGHIEVKSELPAENPDNNLTTLERGKKNRGFTTIGGGCVVRRFGEVRQIQSDSMPQGSRK